MNTSLRRRLIGWISIPILLASLLIFTGGYVSAWHEVEEIYDAQMVHSAKVLLQLTTHELMEDEGVHLGTENTSLHHKYERKMGFRVWVDGKLITQSSNVSEFASFEAPPGFSDQDIGEYKWRFFVFIDPAHKIQVEMSERYDVRYELINQLMSALVLPALLLIVSIVVLVWIGVRKAIMPVVKISGDVDARGTDDLSPISSPSIPDEISPLVQALNRLFLRIQQSFQREREFTDHAAHELRTPLAAMKTQTQVLMKKAADMPECRDGLENLNASINRATHLVNQLLSLSRLQHDVFALGKMDLSGCVREALDEALAGMNEKGLIVKADIADSILVKGNSAYIAILLRNLLDNAMKYTPSGGTVTVSLKPSGLLSVADTGAGVPDADKARIFDRFVRVDKTGQEGSGLGLSIVQGIAAAHHAPITLRNNTPHGLIVDLQWTVLS